MSRLDHDIERGLQQIADRATPSPDAWAQIRSRIAGQEPIQETEIIMLTENTLTTRRWPLVAAAAAVIALVVGVIALVNRGDGEEIPADDPPVPTVPEVVDPQPDAIDPELAASPLPPEGAEIPPGRYSTDAFGVPASFEVPDVASAPWTVLVNNREAVVLGYGGNTFVAIKRIGSFYDADEAQDPSITGLGSIPPDDIDRWIELNGVIVDERTEVTVADRDAEFRRFRLPADAGDAACPAEGAPPCLNIVSSSADHQDFNVLPTALQTDLPTSVWMIELGEYEPLGILAYSADVDSQTWLDELAPLIDSIELGEPGPAVEGGTARLSTFGADAAEAGGLPEAGQQLAPGTYTSDAIGVPVTFDLRDGQTAPWTLLAEGPGGIQMISDETGREFVAIGRAGSWYDADEARDENTRGLGSIPADGIDTWIAVNGVIVVDSSDVVVGGRNAKYRLIRLDTTPGATADFCPSGEAPCLWAGTGSADLVEADTQPTPFGRDRVQAVWSVEMDEFEPILIFAAANLDDDGPWFTDTVQPIVDSITFGEPAPVVPGGTARVPLRVTVSAPFSGVRTNVERLEDGSISVVYEATIEGAITGEITGTDTVIQGVPSTGIGEDTFTGTIEGIGTGTISWTTEWSASNPTDYEGTSVVTGGTGDFAGATGTRVLNVETSDSVDGVDAVTGTETFELVIPRSG